MATKKNRRIKGIKEDYLEESMEEVSITLILFSKSTRIFNPPKKSLLNIIMILIKAECERCLLAKEKVAKLRATVAGLKEKNQTLRRKYYVLLDK